MWSGLLERISPTKHRIKVNDSDTPPVHWILVVQDWRVAHSKGSNSIRYSRTTSLNPVKNMVFTYCLRIKERGQPTVMRSIRYVKRSNEPGFLSHSLHGQEYWLARTSHPILRTECKQWILTNWEKKVCLQWYHIHFSSRIIPFF